MHWMGLASAPRRTFLTYAPYAERFGEWHWGGVLTAAGGVIMFVSGGVFLFIMLRTIFGRRLAEPVTVPEAQPLMEPGPMPRWLDRISPWFALGLALSTAAWLPSLWRMAAEYPTMPGFRLW